MAVAATAATLALTACGGDDEPEAAELSSDEWVMRADRYCTDGTQEATALPLPASSRQVAPDAAARAEIVAFVRDGLLTLGRPEGVDEADLAAFLGELDDDIELLSNAATATSEDGSSVTVDESAGQAANELGLPGCAAFVNAVARTP